MRLLPLLPVVSLALMVGAGCGGGGRVEIPDPIVRDLDAIQARDTLVVLTQFNSTSYFLYRGEPLGYEYELLRRFADANDLYLQPVVVRDRDSLLVLLNAGVGDVIAARLSPTTFDSAHVALTQPLYETRPVVVQRAERLAGADVPAAVDSLLDSLAAGEGADTVRVQGRLVRRPEGLAGEEVHVLAGTLFERRLVELSDALTGDIYVVEVDSGTAEMLMRDVAQGAIRYTIGPENVAQLQETYYTNLAIRPTLGEPYEVSWAVRRNAPQLLTALNAWVDDNPGMAQNLYTRYFVDRQGYRERIADDYLASETGRLSPYDALFKEHAPRVGWDWRLLASQAFQESRFEERARSWAGAMGILQLMPGTARQYGVSDPYDPSQNVDGAVGFLEYLHDFWGDEIADESERLKFILASYNAGPGHVADARRLTEKNGGDPSVWADVAYWLLRKSERAVYTDPVVRHGFCRGLEPVTYVERILDRYAHYLQFVEPAEPGMAGA